MKLDPKRITTVRDLCLAYVQHQKAMLKANDPNGVTAATLKDYRYSLEGQIIPRFGEMTIKSFKRTHTAQFLFKAREEKRATRANRDVAALASAFNLAMSLGLIEDNPCRGVRRNKERPRTRSVSIAEVNDLLALAEQLGGSSKMVALIALTVALTGRRRSEVLSLPVEAVTGNGIQTEDSKSGKRGFPRVYLIKWSPLLRQLVQQAVDLGRAHRPENGPLFPTRTGEPYTDSGFKTMWSRLMKVYEERHGDRFRAHDLRALYVSEMLGQERDPKTHQNENTMRRVYDRRKVIEIDPLA